MLKIGEIRELIRLLDETTVSELKIELDDMKLQLKKADTSVALAPVAATPVLSVPAGQSAAPIHTTVLPEASPATPAPVTEPVAAAAPASDASLHVIKSPMVGTFYSAPSPDSAPYVTRGAKVDKKTIVCIVEAMKLMNEIEAEVNGEVVEILVENGQLVEYGQPLFKIRLS